MARKAKRKARKAPSAKQRANWARFAAMARGKSRAARASNPAKRRAKRRSVAPAAYSARRMTRRRRNPISLGGGRSVVSAFMGQFKTAAAQGAGAVAIDFAYGQLSRFLPAMLQRTPGKLGVGDVVKMFVAVALGELLNKPTRGMSRQAATGSLTVQISDIVRGFMPAGALGYYVPAMTVNRNTRIGPNSRGPVMQSLPGQVGAYTRPGYGTTLSSAAGRRDGQTVR